MACVMRGDLALSEGLTKALFNRGMDATLIRMTFAGNPDAVRQALLELAADPRLCSISQDLRSSAEIVLAEVLNNIAEHAYADRAGSITLQLERRADGLFCIVRDTGAPMPGFGPPTGDQPPLGAIEDLPEGGFGWFLIRNLTEGLAYRHADGVNCLSFALIEKRSAY